MRALEKVRVVCVACGARNAHMLAAADNGSLWAWGSGQHGKLGKGDTTSYFEPTKVAMFPVGIVQVECGTQFSVLLTKDGRVHTWSVHTCTL